MEPAKMEPATRTTGTYTIGSSAALEPTVSSLVKIYEKLAFSKYEKQCAIMKLSLQNLAPIFHLLDTEDRKSVRVVCKSFKEALDQFVGIYVNLDQSQIEIRERWYPISMPPPGACSLRLWNAYSPKYLDYILKRSHLVTEVQFAGQVSLSSVTKIITRCANLQKLSFTDRSHMYASILPVRLNQLHTLDLGCPGHSSDYIGEESVASTLWMTYEMILKKLSAPSLKVFRVYLCCVEDCTILHRAIAQIFRFLAAHKLLESLGITLHHRYERFAFLEKDANYNRFKVDIPKKQLRTIQLKRIQVETMEPAFKVWDFILPAQRFLTHLDVMNRNRRWFYYSKLVYNNHVTLKEIRIHNISPKKAKSSYLDASIFSACKVLETLFLSRFENSTQEIVYCYPNGRGEFPYLDMETSSTPEIIKLNELPATIKTLHLQGLVVSTEDLSLAIGKLKNLNFLELQLLGYYHPDPGKDEGDGEIMSNKEFLGRNLGVTANVIRKILTNCRELDTLFIEEFENSWTKTRDTDLWDALYEINQIPEDGYSTDGGYYGVLLCSEILRNNGRLTRAERMHLWDVRLSQYFLHINRRRHSVNRRRGISEMESRDSLVDSSEDSQVDPIISETSLLEIIDKENGQLEKIQQMLSACQTPPPITHSQLRAEETREYAKRYCATIYSAIPNYHKATRLLEELSDN